MEYRDAIAEGRFESLRRLRRQRYLRNQHDRATPSCQNLPDRFDVNQRLATPRHTVKQGGRVHVALERNVHATALLYGVTGSGKTLIYVEAIRQVLAARRRAIVLVPEISLTPQTAQRFEAAFGDRVAVLHSALSERERFDAWQACARGEIDVVVGARSAVFAPLPSVGLIVVDEAHDPSYKQEVVPRYQAVAVAAERMRLESGLLLL